MSPNGIRRSYHRLLRSFFHSSSKCSKFRDSVSRRGGESLRFGGGSARRHRANIVALLRSAAAGFYLRYLAAISMVATESCGVNGGMACQ